MKKMNLIFAYFTMTAGVVASIISIYNGQSFVWQFCTAVWAGIAAMNQQQYDKMVELFEDTRKHMDNLIEVKQPNKKSKDETKARKRRS